MKPLFAFILAAHGAIHLMGFAKAFGLAELPALTRLVPRPVGALWLLAALLFLAAAVALYAWPRGFWMIGAAAVIVSQILIIPSWIDARFGTVANVIALVGVLYGFLQRRR